MNIKNARPFRRGRSKKAKAGIYAIINNKNGHRYVGQSRNISNRRDQHWRDLVDGRHHNFALQRDFSRDAKSNFSFVVLEEIQDPNKLDEREKYWIERLHAEYNIVKDPARHRLENSCLYVQILRQGQQYQRKSWEAWVYGGARNPLLDIRHTP